MSRRCIALLLGFTVLPLGACHRSAPNAADPSLLNGTVNLQLAVETQDPQHPIVTTLEQRLQSMRKAAEAGDWEQYRQYRTKAASEQLVGRLAKMNVDLSINELIKASAKHLKDPSDHTFLRCDASDDGKSARLAYETNATTHEGFWVLMFHLEDGHWRLGDSGNTITTPEPDADAESPTLEAAIEDLGLRFAS